ncbi:MAG: low-specificity L-threonine aldolase [Stappiaceae bacterium]
MMNQILHDFRSDTVTKPSAAMRQVIADAEVGDDVFGDDPTVLRLEAIAAEMAGKEAGLFVSSGTQANLTALMSHCARGEEYIVGQMQHNYRWEAGGAAVLGSIQPQPIPNQPDGTLRLEDIEANIKPDDSHFAISRLLSLENTIGGQILPLTYMSEATALARKHGLSCHLDGARAFNAIKGLNVSLSELVADFDTVSLCLSKGLGAPVGSVLVGQHDLIARARRLRKMLGGGMRQVGVLAAAGLYVLENNIDRLSVDHANAARLAEGLDAFPALNVLRPQTNIFWVDVDEACASAFADYLSAQGIGVTSLYGGTRQRWVTHLDVDEKNVEDALHSVGRFFDQL